MGQARWKPSQPPSNLILMDATFRRESPGILTWETKLIFVQGKQTDT